MDADDVEGGEGDLEGGDLAPQSQVILTGCWLTMKEISLLLGIIATCAPLPGVCVTPTASPHANLIAANDAFHILQ